MKRRSVTRATLVVLGAFVLGLSACSDDGDDDATPPSTTAARQTVITGPIPAPTVTIGPAEPATTRPVVTQPITPTQPSLTAAPPPGPATTITAGPTCDAATLFAVLQAGDEPLPPGTGADPPACAGAWATMVIGAPDQDRALAVFESAGGWVVRGIGNDGVCTGAGVPAELFGALGCALWETS